MNERALARAGYIYVCVFLCIEARGGDLVITGLLKPARVCSRGDCLARADLWDTLCVIESSRGTGARRPQISRIMQRARGSLEAVITGMSDICAPTLMLCVE